VEDEASARRVAQAQTCGVDVARLTARDAAADADGNGSGPGMSSGVS